MEEKKIEVVNISNFKEGTYRVRFLPLSSALLTTYYVVQWWHFFGSAVMPCNRRNITFQKKCPTCKDTWALWEANLKEKCKPLYPRDVYFSNIQILNNKGELSKPFPFRFSKQLYGKLDHAEKKYNTSICHPTTGFLFDIVVEKIDQGKWNSYENSESYNGQPYPLNNKDWSKGLYDVNQELLTPMSYEECLAFYNANYGIENAETGGYANPKLYQEITQQSAPKSSPLTYASQDGLHDNAPRTEVVNTAGSNSSPCIPPCHATNDRVGFSEGDSVCMPCPERSSCMRAQFIRESKNDVPVTEVPVPGNNEVNINEVVNPQEVYPEVNNTTKDMEEKMAAFNNKVKA